MARLSCSSGYVFLILFSFLADTLRTETEFPPFAVGKAGEHPCEIFTVDGKGDRKVITHCHGEIQFDVDTDDLAVNIL